MSRTSYERFRGWLLAAATAAVFAAWAPRLGPAPQYNSDVAVQVLAANGASPGGVFLLYYPGQERLGGWPTLVARALTPLTGPWDPHRMHLLILGVVLSAVFPVARLAGTFAGLGTLLACAWPSTVTLNLAYHQPYGAQLASLLWAWWAMRRSADGASGRWLALALVFATLSSWSSPTSGPLLLMVALAELLRARALGRSGWKTTLLLLAPPFGGAAGEAAIRVTYRLVRNSTPGWPNFATRYGLDRGHLWENARAVGERLGQTGGGLLVGAGLIAGGLAALHLWRRRGRADAAAVILGTALGSCVTWAILVGVRHVRLNLYSDRYLAPAIFLATLAAWTLVGVLASELLERFRPQVGLACFAGAAVGVVTWVPRSGEDPTTPWRTTAEALVAAAPGGVLVADYWTTYALAAVVPPGMLTPMTPEGEWGRFPQSGESLRVARAVVVGSEGLLVRPSGGAPPVELCQRGVRLALVRPDLAAPGPQRFALYAPAGSCPPTPGG